MPGIAERETASQPSWLLQSGNVEMAVTHLGAHMAPVTFFRNSSSPVQPYFISPWQGEEIPFEPGRPEIPLRGDFFCMPFGLDQNPDSQEKHPLHGEPSGSPWEFVAAEETSGVHTLTIGMTTKVRPCRIARTYSLVDGENVVYDCVTIRGFSGPATFAHHAMLRVPTQERSLLISTTPLQFGMVCPRLLGDPAGGEYQALEIGAEFHSLAQVPSIFKHLSAQDCSSFPARQGFTDLIQLAQTGNAAKPVWTAVVNTVENYLWFSLKKIETLPTLVIWMENRGRHQPPWNRRTCVVGLEDACTFFDYGIPASERSNAFSSRGVETHRILSGDPFHIRYIQGVVQTPAGFGCVANADITSKGVVFQNARGEEVSAPVQTGFLDGKSLAR
jgi:hypothetical protein